MTDDDGLKLEGLIDKAAGGGLCPHNRGLGLTLLLTSSLGDEKLGDNSGLYCVVLDCYFQMSV